MQFDHYQNRAAELAAELVNAHLDDAPSIEELRAVLDDWDIALHLEGSDQAPLAELAAELVPVFAATEVAAAVPLLNASLTRTPMAPWVSTHDGRPPHLHVEPADATPVERIRANCLMGLAAVLCDGGRLRIGTCDGSNCARVYVDTSRNARRRFCSDRCATRTHVAAHRARRASA